MRGFLIWILAIIITLAAAVYQRATGPTYPFKGDTQFGQEVITYKLPRSHSTNSPCEVTVTVPNPEVNGSLTYHRYPSHDEWTQIPMKRDGNELKAELPNQPPAGKLQYYITLSDGQKLTQIGVQEPIVIRFKGDVPPGVLIPHILFMFVAMLLSNVTGIKAILKDDNTIKYAWVTFVCLTVGGMILGPIVQKYAFDAYWTGVPFGWDLTDNKTLVAFLAWLGAILVNHKTKRPSLFIMAALITLLVYMIPHSMMGSELDYETMEVQTG